jgi:hypothetical protein
MELRGFIYSNEIRNYGGEHTYCCSTTGRFAVTLQILVLNLLVTVGLMLFRFVRNRFRLNVFINSS